MTEPSKNECSKSGALTASKALTELCPVCKQWVLVTWHGTLARHNKPKEKT